MLIASHLSKQYGTVAALRDISLSIKPGELTVILGPSGSGKTTLLRCLCLLDRPDTGTLEVDGILRSFPAQRTGKERLYPKVGAVFQGLALWPHLTLRQNILLPLEVLGVKEDHHAYVDSLIDTFGMDRFVDRLPRQVSGGERQRAALVRALALRPSYLLLDEITSALDVEQVAIVLQQLERLKQSGMGILLITHLIGFARRAADRFVFLNDGTALETGQIQDLETPTGQRLATFLQRAEAAS